MGIREDMEAMMNGNFTEEVMSDEEKQLHVDADKGGSTEPTKQETSQQNDNIDKDNQAAKPTETGGEITGDAGDENKPHSGEDTTVNQEAGSDVDTKDVEVAQGQENTDGQADSDAGNAQPDEVDKNQEDGQKNEADDQAGELNYKLEYEKLVEETKGMKAFRDTVTADFKANGKMVKGIDDADKIVKNLQMSTGLANKLTAYKEAKQFIDPMQKRGFMQNPDKFDVHMKMEDGDIGAVKQFLKDKGIDPIDLDIEDDFSYKTDSTRVSPEEMMFGEMQDTASGYGVEDKFTSTVLNEWDSQSAGRLFDGDQGKVMAEQLAKQMSNGIYDKVSAISENMKITQPGFRGLSSIEQYNKASEVYNQALVPDEPKVVQEQAQAAPAMTEADMRTEIEAQVRAEIKAKTEADYKSKLEADKAAEDARLQASSFSANQSTSNAPQSTEPQSFEERQREFERMKRL